MLPPKNNNFLMWCAGISVALICLVIVLPTLLFKFYPYSIVLTIVYGATEEFVQNNIIYALFCPGSYVDCCFDFDTDRLDSVSMNLECVSKHNRLKETE